MRSSMRGGWCSRMRAIWASLDRGQRWTIAMMVAVVAGLHAAGFLTLIALVAPHHYRLGTAGAFTVGLGVTAYTLGMRHAFDADHISAIDNTTRKLMAEGKRPLSVGFWFSLGHSTIVVALTLLLGLGLKGLGVQLTDDKSGLHNFGGLVGTTVSGTFLYLIAIINLVVLVGILKVFRQMRRGEFDEATLEEHLNNRGLMNRFLGRAMRAVNKPWQIYPVGALFGLGFDTVTEVGLLVLAGTSVATGLPWYAVMCLPILFAAGMSLLDTVDGSFMNFAYGWAFSKPVRKVFYNITVTALSVAVAFIVGSAELLSTLASKLGLHWGWLQTLNFNALGYVIVALFVLTWVLALAVWRLGHIEEKWTRTTLVVE